MRRILTLTFKDLLLLTRDKFALFWVLGFPLIMALFFGAMFGGGGGARGRMTLAIVDEDHSYSGQRFVATLARSASVRLVEKDEAGEPLDLPTARDRVRLGKATAYLLIRKGFGASFMGLAGSNTGIEVGIDPGRKAEAGFLQGILMQTVFSNLTQQFRDPAEVRKWLDRGRQEIDAAKTLTPLQKDMLKSFLKLTEDFLPKLAAGNGDANELPDDGGLFKNVMKVVPVTHDVSRPRSAWEITFPASVSWALLGCMVTFAVSMVIERRQGTMLRLRLAPLSRAEILAGKGLACFLACSSAACVLLAIGMTFLGIRIVNPAMAVLAIAAAAFCFSGVMMLVSVIGKSEQAVGGAASALMVVMAMLGGGMIPLIAMPEWMLHVSSVSPVKWGILALEGAIWRGFSLQEMALPLGILLGVGTAAFLLGTLILQNREARG